MMQRIGLTTRGQAIVLTVLGVAAALGIGGWVANIVKIFGADLEPLTGILVVRFAGVFIPPLGSVMGYL